jgi:hypothetical protein
MGASPTTTSTVTQIAQQMGINPSIMLAIMQNESGGNVNAQNPGSSATGLFQITTAAWQSVNGKGTTPSTDIIAQAVTATTLMKNALAASNGDLQIAYLAYAGGPAFAARVAADPNYPANLSLAISNAATHFPSLNNPATIAELQNDPVKFNSTLASIGGGTPTPSTGSNLATSGGTSSSAYSVDDTKVPIASNSPTGQPLDSTLVSQLDAVTSYVIPEGTNNIAWFNDPDIFKGNAGLRNKTVPVTFAIQLPNSSALTDTIGTPLFVKLYSSLKNWEIHMAHQSNKTQTRTGLMVTLWGQQADQIVGSGTTGMFMNQAGITQFLSMVGPLDPAVVTLLNRSLGNEEDSVTGQSKAAELIANQKSLRVAAEDCFMEMLSVFKNNGNIYFRNQNYTKSKNTGAVTNLEQVGVSAWAPSAGVSTNQMNSRNNDVMSRGAVIMQFKNSSYTGYFKSLAWSVDAEKPFQWSFNFVFQVQSTVTRTFSPELS